jgi:hypothetical protein
MLDIVLRLGIDRLAVDDEFAAGAASPPAIPIGAVSGRVRSAKRDRHRSRGEAFK